MAIAIKSIPTLKDNVAEVFVSKAEASSAKRAAINFSKQVESTKSILKKAKMR